jgi:prevent-host-death family protein
MAGKAGKRAGRVAKVSELKAGLSAYLARVKRGEEVLVTERGTPIARLVPVAERRGRPASALEERMERLIREGRAVRYGTGRVSEEFWKLPLPTVPDASLSQAVIEERGEGW